MNRNEPPSAVGEDIRFKLPPAAMRKLEFLLHTGLYGGTLGSVARRLTERGLEQAMRDWKDLPA